MRADRLLSIILLLQARGRMPARVLARELEVSERTIYRDVEALSAAGVPIYADTGRNGGFALLDHYRTTLTGLTENEARALFMLSNPAPLVDLGLSQDLGRALGKISAALPVEFRQDETWVRQRFLLDTGPVERQADAVPHLRTVQQAVWADRRIELTWRPPFAGPIEQIIDPFALVARTGDWYLVYGRHGAVRVRRIAEIIALQLLSETFSRPADFDLAEFWDSWRREFESGRQAYTASLRVAPELIPLLPMYFGGQINDQVAQAGPPDAKGWIRLTLSFRSLEEARDRLLAFGRAVEVLEPRPLRQSILDYAGQIVSLYDRHRGSQDPL